VRGVEHVDIDTEVHREVADPLADAVDTCRCDPGDVRRRDGREAERPVVVEVALGIERPTQADVAPRPGASNPSSTALRTAFHG